MPVPTQPPPPFLPDVDPTLIQRRLNIPQMGDPRLGGPYGATPGVANELTRLIAALADVRRGGVERRGAQAGRAAELGALEEFAALQNMGWGSGAQALPVSPLAQTRQEQAQAKEVRVRNIRRPRRKARVEGAPPTPRELVKQQEALARMVQKPEFYKALQENETSRQMANNLLASKNIYIPSLQEEQEGQAELPSDVRSHLAFYEIGLERAEESGLTGAKAREAAREFADKQRTAFIRGAPSRLDIEKEKGALRETLATQQHEQRMAEIRLRAELASKAQAIDLSFRKSMAGSGQRLKAMDLLLELSRDIVNQGLLTSMFGDTLEEKITNQFRMWGVSEEAISALGEALAEMAQAEVGAPGPAPTPVVEPAPAPGANPYLK